MLFMFLLSLFGSSCLVKADPKSIRYDLKNVNKAQSSLRNEDRSGENSKEFFVKMLGNFQTLYIFLYLKYSVIFLNYF